MAGNDLLNAVHANPKILVSQQMPDTTDDTVYTAPGTGSAILKHGTLCNVGGTTVTLNLSILKSGQVSGSGVHRVLSGFPLAAGDTLSLRDYIEGCCLGPGDFVTVTSDTANALDVVISGVEYS